MQDYNQVQKDSQDWLVVEQDRPSLSMWCTQHSLWDESQEPVSVNSIPVVRLVAVQRGAVEGEGHCCSVVYAGLTDSVSSSAGQSPGAA